MSYFNKIFRIFAVLAVALIIVLGWRPTKAGIFTAKNPTTNGLIGYWNFEEGDPNATATDRSGSGNNGTLTNGPTVTSGIIGQALKFDGSNDYVEIADNNALDLTTSGTISAWINVTSQPAGNGFIVNKAINESTTPNGYSISYIANGGCSSGYQIRIDIGNGTSYNAPGLCGTLSLNRWYHLAGTWSSGGTVVVYLDGAQAGSVANTVTPTNNATTLTIGAGRNTGSIDDFFTGKIDEVRLYNRALSAAEIAAIYQTTTHRTIMKSPPLNNGLIGYWNFEEGSGTTANDRSGNGNNGSIEGGAPFTDGKIGQALDLDGTDDRVLVTTNSGLETNTNVTVALWINPDDAAKATSQQLASKYSSTPQNGYVLYIPASVNTIKWELRLGSCCQAVQALTALVNGTWQHVVATYDGATLKVYINGVLENSSASSGTLTSTNNLALGADWSGATVQPFDGRMDEVRLYNRALSAGEIAALYQSTAVFRPTRKATINTSQNTRFNNSLVGLWSFNGPDVSGTTATDISGNGNTGTLTNGPTVVPGIIGQALNFDGVNDYVNVGNASGLNPSTAITLAGWIKIVDTTSQLPIVARWAASSFRYMIDVFNKNARFFIRDSAGTQGLVTGSTALEPGTWYHVAGVYNGTTMTLYVNAVSEGALSGSIPASMDAGTAATLIGTKGDATTEYFNGPIDELRIYNRALSSSEITEIYNAGKRQ